MVKNNLVNKNVVRALSIGLSLAMASQPMTAMASTGDQPEGEPITSDGVATPATDAKAEEPEVKAADVLGEVINPFTTQGPILGAVEETNEAIGAVDVANVAAPGQIDKKVNEAGLVLAVEEDTNFNFISDAAEKDGALVGNVTGATINEGIINGLEPKIEEQIDKVNGTLENKEKTGANDIVDAAGALLTNTDETLKTAEQQVEQSEKDIAAATTVEAANAAYGEAKDKVDAANKAVENTKTELARLEGEYAKASAEYDTEKAEFDRLTGLYDAAISEYNRYKEAAKNNSGKLYGELERLEKDAEALKAAADAAKIKADNKKAEADRLKGEAENAKSEAEKALKDLKESEYAKLYALEAALNARIDNNYKTYNPWTKETTEHGREDDPVFSDGTSAKKGTYDEYFDEVVKLYYVPQVLDGEFVSLKWQKNSDGELNYCDVTYKVKDANGQETTVTKKLNYKLNENNDQHKFGGLVIFEKTEHFYFDETELTQAERDEIDKKGYILKGTEHIRKNADGEYVAFNDKDASYDIHDALADENTTVVVDNDTKKTTWTYANGALTKTVTADTTVTTFTGASLVDGVAGNSASAFDSEAASKAAFVSALRAKLAEDKSNKDAEETVIIENANFQKFSFVKGKNYTDEELLAAYVEDNYTSTTGYKLNVGYNNKFTATVHINGYVDSGAINFYISDSEARDAFDSEAKKKANEYDYQDNIGPWFDQKGTELLNYTTSNYNSVEEGFEHHNVLGFEWDTNDGRSYSGDVAINYAKLSKIVVHKDWLIFNGINIDNKSSEKVLADKGITGIKIVDTDQWDGEGLNKYTVYYYLDDATKEVVVAGDKLSDINNDSVMAALRENGITAENLNLSYDVNMAVEQTRTKYGYKSFSFNVMSVLAQNMKVSETNWSATEAVEASSQYRNDNYYNNNLLFGTTYKNGPDYTIGSKEIRYEKEIQDLAKDYRKALSDKQKEISDKEKEVKRYQDNIDKQDKASKKQAALSLLYANISKQANDADKAVERAENRVTEIKDMLDKLGEHVDGYEAQLKEKKEWLKDAQSRLAAAIQRRDALLDALDELDDQLTAKVNQLTPSPSGEGGGETGTDEGTTGTVVLPAAETLGTPVLTAGPLVFAPGAVVANAAPAVAENTVDLNEQRTALSDAAPETQTEQTTTNIDDGKTALAAAPINEESLSWWWLLIIAVLGGAGYAMYKKFHAKKDEKTN